MARPLQNTPRGKYVTHVFANFTDQDISVDSLGLNPSQHGGSYKLTSRLEHDNDRNPVYKDYNQHMLGPGQALVVSSQLLPDIKAIAPQLTDLGPAATIARRGRGWDMMPLTHLERWMFIDSKEHPTELIELTYKELVAMGCA